MFKNIVAPVQAWLLSQGKCVGCGRVLAKKKGKAQTRVDCLCGRIYFYSPPDGKFRRAKLHEV